MLDQNTVEIELRLREFGQFLRSRREKLAPKDVGLPAGFRRRTPGLRREEVALLAGIGGTWYTWLEQGRDVRPSVEVLDAIAVALKLNPAEKRHLFTLAAIPVQEQRSEGAEQVPDSITRMLNGMENQPAYVLGRRWDILAWNSAAAEVFGDFSQLEGDQRNLIYMMFASQSHQKLFVDWDQLAPVSLAMFRADCAFYAGNKDFERLIGLLKAESEVFTSWWTQHDVTHQPSTIKRIQHPELGLLVFEYMSLSVDGCPGMRLIVCTPREKSTGL
ncbi:helix-turn-helix transcriptional regulator [Rouxiella sp. WC2420]|uniref:Helix-turn-helix transcriptional regulator n=1 Tax=Rouxiella sp. WC2420 TaxID=3234145 RepID=A0AB39VM31_9GAMM